MKNFIVLISLFFFCEKSFALKYMCQKAVRSNSGKYNSIKSQLAHATNSGELNSKRDNLIFQAEKAINSIKNASCPMSDPEVTKVTTPLTQLITEIKNTESKSLATTKSSSKEEASTITSEKKNSQSITNKQSTSAKTTIKKLSYQCRQVLQRQGGKPREMDKALSFYRQAVKGGKTVRAVPGLEVDYKIKASLNDLESGQCPQEHPDVKKVIDQLKSQLDEVPKLYAKLKEKLDARAKTADTKSYSDYEKDIAFFKYLDEKYTGIERMYDSSPIQWREIKSNINSLGNIAINVKRPIYKFKALKDIIVNMRTDGEKYNKLMPEVEKKYKDLFKYNQKVGSRYVYIRNSAQKKMSTLYSTHFNWLKENLPKAIEMNQKVLKLLAKKADEEKSPHYFKGVVVPDANQSNKQMIEILSFLSETTKAKAEKLKKEQDKINTMLASARKNLAKKMLEEEKLSPEKYNGTDKEKIRANILKKWKEQHPNREVIKLQFVNENWKITNYVSWSSGHATHHYYSDLGVLVIVKENSEVAKLIPAWYRVNHKKKDQVSIGFTESNESDIYENRKILIKNL